MMIDCPNCNHVNPDGATQCEACYTDLPQLIACPSCGASIQTDATFCGQCGYNLQPIKASPETNGAEKAENENIPTAMINHQTVPSPWDEEETNAEETAETSVMAEVDPIPAPSPMVSATQLQVYAASLLHVQTQTRIELPLDLSVIHMGKPNDRIPPDVDVSGFPNSEVVSRIHADIRVEGDAYYLEDMGSSNGTYVNHTPLPQGNRHRLRSGDRVSLGKGDLVTFIFQV